MVGGLIAWVPCSVTLVVEIQDQGFTGNKPKSPLPFEILFNGLTLSLTFTSQIEIWVD
jgi:hypothetical protein